MQIVLTCQNTGIIDIPVNYNYYVQSAIFKILADENSDYAEYLHNIADGSKTRYKFFTFGSLIGKSHFYNKTLYYEGGIKLEIRSVSNEFLQVLANSILNGNKLCIGKHCLSIKDVDIRGYTVPDTLLKIESICLKAPISSSYTVPDTLLKIRTLTPIVAKKQTEDNHTEYYSPQDVRFIKRIRETFENKYNVFVGQVQHSSIDILPLNVGKKVVTKYKDTWITAYHGTFEICGSTECLQFLYDVGLGVKTSQGFGMFEVI